MMLEYDWYEKLHFTVVMQLKYRKLVKTSYINFFIWSYIFLEILQEQVIFWIF